MQRRRMESASMDCDVGEPMLTTRHRNHFVNSKEGRALYGDAE